MTLVRAGEKSWSRRVLQLLSSGILITWEYLGKRMNFSVDLSIYQLFPWPVFFISLNLSLSLSLYIYIYIYPHHICHILISLSTQSVLWLTIPMRSKYYCHHLTCLDTQLFITYIAIRVCMHANSFMSYLTVEFTEWVLFKTSQMLLLPPWVIMEDGNICTCWSNSQPIQNGGTRNKSCLIFVYTIDNIGDASNFASVFCNCKKNTAKSRSFFTTPEWNIHMHTLTFTRTYIDRGAWWVGLIVIENARWSMFAIQFQLIPLEKVWIYLLSRRLLVNRRADGFVIIGMTTTHERFVGSGFIGYQPLLSFKANSLSFIYIRYMISKHIFEITFSNDPELVFSTVKWFYTQSNEQIVLF